MKLVRVQGKVGGQWSADQFYHAYVGGQNTLGTMCPLPGTNPAIQAYDSGSCGIYLAENMIEVLEVMKMNSYFRLNYLNTTTFFTGAGILPVCTTFPESAPDMTSTIFFLFSSSFSVRSNSVVVRLNVWKSSSSAPAVCPVPRSAVGSVTTRK